jgi:2-keto-4-pentenoate hydratase
VIDALALDRAVESHVPLDRSTVLPSVEEAYRIQGRFVAARAARTGSAVSGYKIAFTSPAAQRSLATGGYASGALLAGDVLATGSRIRLTERFTPILEVELVVRAREDLAAWMGDDELAARLDVAAGLEIPESRFADWFGGEYPALTLPEVVADDCLAGLVVVGDRWTPATSLTPAASTAVLRHDGRVVREGSVALVVPDPLAALGWLVRQLDARGLALHAGQVVSTGTWTDTIRLEPGEYRAEFSGGLGEVVVEVEG